MDEDEIQFFGRHILADITDANPSLKNSNRIDSIKEQIRIELVEFVNAWRAIKTDVLTE